MSADLPPAPAPAARGPDSPADRSALLGLDHVVLAVQDLDAACADYTAQGFTVVRGGRHPGRTSHNALIVFDDGAYIELIAWTAPAPQERWWRVLQAGGEGLVDFALLPLDTAAAVAAARARGLAGISDPLDGGRVRPDGVALQWRSARQATSDLPFLCGDVTPRAGRVPEGEVRQHANGARGVAMLRVAVDDLARSVQRYRALLGPGIPVEFTVRAGDGEPTQATFTLGSTRFELRPMAAGVRDIDSLGAKLDPPGEGPKEVRLFTSAGADVLPAIIANRHHVSLESAARP